MTSADQLGPIKQHEIKEEKAKKEEETALEPGSLPQSQTEVITGMYVRLAQRHEQLWLWILPPLGTYTKVPTRNN